MTTALLTYDETMSGERVAGPTLSLPATRITLRDLIRARVYEETKEYNRRMQESAAKLRERAAYRVQPAATEVALNGAVLVARPSSTVTIRPVKLLDWEEQAQRALVDFGRNRYFVLVGDRQVETLDEQIELYAGAEVTFLRLIPLAGG
jgi:hypothetical protein